MSTVQCEFSGCLYEAPTLDGGARDLRIDSTSGATFPFDLTKDEISGMRFSGVPVKIEHTLDGFSQLDDNEVGSVSETVTDPTTGYTAVKFALHDTVAGRTVSRLINSGGLKELSLGHNYDPVTGKVNPSEVSVCFNGARSGSRLYKEMGMYDRFKESVRVKNMSMADQQDANATTERVVSPSEHLQNGLIASSLGANASAPSAQTTPKGIIELLESVTSAEGVDPAHATELYKQFKDFVGEHQMQTQDADKNRLLIADLQKQVELVADKSKTNAKKVRDTMNALLCEYGVNDSVIDDSAGDEDSTLKQVALQIPVLASALHAHKHAALNAGSKIDALAQMRSGFAAEFKKAMSPWKDADHGQSSRGEEYQPGIMVNASARGRERDGPTFEEPPKKKSGHFSHLSSGQQSILAGITSYGDGASGRLTRDMLPANFFGKDTKN